MRFLRALRPSTTLPGPSSGSGLSRLGPAGAASSPLPSSAPSSVNAFVRPCRRYSCSSNSSGRSSSRDGSSARVKAPAATPSRTTSSTPSSAAPKPVQVAPRISATPSTYNLPHVSANLVKFDSLFSLHRPLLELPVQMQNRRSIKHKNDATALAAAEQLETTLEETRPTENGSDRDAHQTVTVAELSEELAEVVDLSDDGTPMGSPYLARLGSVEPIKTVEEELAAEAKEEEALAMHEEQLHDMEKDEAEPYDAWMIGQHEPLPHSIARYLALRPPHEAPESRLSTLAPDSASTSSLPSKTISDLSFLSPFGKPASTSASSDSALPRKDSPSPPTSAYASAFSKHFLRPLDPTDAAAVADQFLSHHQLVHTWAARNDFVNQAAESLRKAQNLYSDAPLTTKSAPVVAQEPTEKGTIKYWTEGGGWATFDLKTGLNDSGSPFLPAEMVDLNGASVEDLVVEMDSTKRKRKKKITKHKYKKRRKAQRALRQRLGK